MFEYTFQWRVVWQHLPELLEASYLTIEITLLSVAIGLFIAISLASIQNSRFFILRSIAITWIALARNTPALLQIYLAYFGLGAVGIHLSSYAAVLAAIAFNNAGYLTEILRGGITSIPRNQNLAGLGLGLTATQTYVYILLPQVLKAVFLPITNQVVWAMLGTSLGMIIGLQELTGMTTFLQSQTFRPFEFYFVTACMYVVIAKLMTLSARWVARKMFHG
jgi:polar amino acid transport system permease protein